MTDEVVGLQTYSETAWSIAIKYSNVLASETRDLAAWIDDALKKRDQVAFEEAAKIAEAHAASDRAKGAHFAKMGALDDGDNTYEDFAVTAETIASSIREAAEQKI